jgi:hypothetical protein
MANIVAADFNPPINNNNYLLSSVGTVHLYSPVIGFVHLSK